MEQIADLIVKWAVPVVCTALFGLLIKGPLNALADAYREHKAKPMEDIRSMLKSQENAIAEIRRRQVEQDEEMHAAKERDLAILDDRICQMIRYCRERGYTTAEERRRIDRMHEVYRRAGGNHGEEHEYGIYLEIPTQEEFSRAYPAMN